jgi:hypothetical protein
VKRLPEKQDPTGFLNLFRYAAAMRFGDPSNVVRGRGRWHHPTKSGPGRRHEGAWNPSRRMATDAGSIGCENRIRALIRAGRQKEAIALYERDRDHFFAAGENRGIPRLRRWYELAKHGDPRAA